MNFPIFFSLHIESNETFTILANSASVLIPGQRSLKGAFKNGSKLFGKKLISKESFICMKVEARNSVKS